MDKKKDQKPKKNEDEAPTQVPNDPHNPDIEIDEPKKKIVPQVV